MVRAIIHVSGEQTQTQTDRRSRVRLTKPKPPLTRLAAFAGLSPAGIAMDTSFRLGNLTTNLPEKVDLSTGTARPTLPRGAILASRFAAEEKRRLFVVFTPVSGRLV